MKALALIALLLISNTIKANSFRDDYRKIMREIRKADDVQLIIGDKVYRGKAVGTSQTFNALTLSYEVSEIKFSGVFFIVFDTAEEAMFLAHFQDSGVPNPQFFNGNWISPGVINFNVSQHQTIRVNVADKLKVSVMNDINGKLVQEPVWKF